LYTFPLRLSGSLVFILEYLMSPYKLSYYYSRTKPRLANRESTNSKSNLQAK